MRVNDPIQSTEFNGTVPPQDALTYQQLFEAERESRLQAETLVSVTLALAAQSNLAAVLDEILAQAHQLVDYQMGHITLLEGGQLHVVCHKGYTPLGLDAAYMRGLQLYLAELPVDEVVIRSRQPLVVMDTGEEPNWRLIPRLEWVRACLIMPIVQQGCVWGLLILDSAQANSFSYGDAERLKPLANAAAVALERARLYEQALDEAAAHEQTAAALRISMEKIEQAKEEWKATVDALPQLVCLLGKNHLVVRINQAVEQWSSGPAEAAVGKSLHQLLHPTCTSRSCFLQHFYRQAWEQLEQGLPFEDSGYDPILDRYLHLQCRPVFQPSSRIYATLLIEDLSEQKKMEEAMLRSQKLESLGVMAGAMAHDFNNLLTGVLTEASLAAKKLAADDPIQIHMSRLIQGIERGAGLTTQLLAYAGKWPRQVAIHNLNQLIRENIALLQATISKEISLQMELDANLPLVELDPEQIQQVIMNLILNAAEAYEGRPGHVLVYTTQQFYSHHGISGLAPGPYVCLIVEDKGIGMSPEVQQRVFDPFFTTKSAGRGLGLAGVQRIAHSHGGEIELESYPQHGSRFKVWLPAYEGVQPAAETPELGSELTLPQTVLVIDDEQAIRVALTDMLELFGVKVLVAENGRAGLELFQQQGESIDLVLLDVTMPILSGIDTFLQLRPQKPDLPIIFLSGYSETEVTSQPRTYFLHKPFHIDQLITQIHTAMSS